MRNYFIYISLLCFSLIPFNQVFAKVELHDFNSPQQQKLYKKLSEELRCLVCQNQNLADSNAELALDMRQKTYQMVIEDKSESEIVDYWVTRYGDFVLYQPRVENQTYLLWYGPVVLLLLGIVVVVWIGRRSFNAVSQDDDDELEESQKKQLEMLLQEKDKKTS